MSSGLPYRRGWSDLETITSIKPLLAVLVSALAVLGIIASRRPNVREAWTLGAAGVKFFIVASMLPAILRGAEIEYTLVQVLPGVTIGFRVDAFGMLFALVASILWAITSIYSIGYMRSLKEHSQTRYFSFFALSLSATIGVAFSANLLDPVPVLRDAVTGHLSPGHPPSGRGGPTVRPQVSAVYRRIVHRSGVAGHGDHLSFDRHPVLWPWGHHGSGGIADAADGLFFLCFCSVLPRPPSCPCIHGCQRPWWHPTPVSALLHAVAVVKVGVFSVVRVMTGVFGINCVGKLHLGPVVCFIASVTVITASFIALSQDGLKRRLAFSTIGQLSYIILGVALLAPSGITGGMLHIAMHAFGKITLFFCAGAIFVATGRKNISEMAGIGKRMPITMGAFFIGSLSVVGLPPCGGFISKWYLVLGTLEADQILLLIVLLTSSLLNAAYFFPIVYKAFFCSPGHVLF